MPGPLIPYIKLPEIPLPFLDFIDPKNPPTIKPFGTLVALGVYLGAVVAIRRARRRGLDVTKLNTFIFYVVGIGFIGGHVFDAIFYTPEKLAADPLYIVKIWGGLSSYGGFIGSIIGTFVYKYVKKEDVLPYVDVVCSAFPLAWVFGRAGCASVHDHPGAKSDAWFAVQYPEFASPGFVGANAKPDIWSPSTWLHYDPLQTMGRFDLGLIEMVLTIPLAVSFYFLWKSKPRSFGFYPGWMSIMYAPVRFVLDFVRIDKGALIGEGDPRYGALTPAQWACFGLLAVGILMVRMSKQHPAPASWADVTPWTEPVDEEDEDGVVAAKDEKPAAAARSDRRRRAAQPSSAQGTSKKDGDKKVSAKRKVQKAAPEDSAAKSEPSAATSEEPATTPEESATKKKGEPEQSKAESAKTSPSEPEPTEPA